MDAAAVSLDAEASLDLASSWALALELESWVTLSLTLTLEAWVSKRSLRDDELLEFPFPTKELALERADSLLSKKLCELTPK